MKGKELVIRPLEVKEIRARLEVTQAELAEALGVSPRTVWEWEKKGAPKVTGYALAGLLMKRGNMAAAVEILFSRKDIFSDS